MAWSWHPDHWPAGQCAWVAPCDVRASMRPAWPAAMPFIITLAHMPFAYVGLHNQAPLAWPSSALDSRMLMVKHFVSAVWRHMQVSWDDGTSATYLTTVYSIGLGGASPERLIFMYNSFSNSYTAFKVTGGGACSETTKVPIVCRWGTSHDAFACPAHLDPRRPGPPDLASHRLLLYKKHGHVYDVAPFHG